MVKGVLGDPVAIYAAVVATVVLVWDILKWRSERRLDLRGEVTANMSPVGSEPTLRQRKYISLRVNNAGHVVCEVQQMTVLPYAHWLDAWRGKLADGAGVIIDPMSGWTKKRLPYRLEHGGTYWGLCEQTKELEELSRTKRVYVGIYHNMSKRPFRVRLRPIAKKQ